MLRERERERDAEWRGWDKDKTAVALMPSVVEAPKAQLFSLSLLTYIPSWCRWKRTDSGHWGRGGRGLVGNSEWLGLWHCG